MMNIEDWKTQIKRGTLEYAILLMINKRDYYGYEIMSELEEHSILMAKENTIYPLLRRLLKEEFLDSYWKDTVEGLPARKYYSITEKGKEYLKKMNEEWTNMLESIKELQGE
ncbi:MAG: PadR family transcriptional regulator [Acetivibrio ethanolgignens]